MSSFIFSDHCCWFFLFNSFKTIFVLHSFFYIYTLFFCYFFISPFSFFLAVSLSFHLTEVILSWLFTVSCGIFPIFSELSPWHLQMLIHKKNVKFLGGKKKKEKWSYLYSDLALLSLVCPATLPTYKKSVRFASELTIPFLLRNGKKKLYWVWSKKNLIRSQNLIGWETASPPLVSSNQKWFCKWSFINFILKDFLELEDENVRGVL